jgi:mono/diheme cytochrome c family protein
VAILQSGTPGALHRSQDMRCRSLFFSFGSLIAALAWAARADDAAEAGRYLAVVGDCAGCHTNGMQPAYSGGRGFSAGFGLVYSSNITPDRATGIANWSAEQFYRALHRGISPDGRHLYPAFPYPYFTHTSRADTDALFAYLKTLKPVRKATPPDRLMFPFNIRAGMAAWNAMFLDPTPLKSDPTKSARWNRGAYIVNGLGHCGACHTPKNAMFGDRKDAAFTGETIDYWFSANLTGSRRDGLGDWSAADIVQYLKTGRNEHAAAAGSMLEVITTSTSRMRDGDLAAIAEYLKSLPPKTAPPAKPPPRTQMQRGEAVFVAYCSACHLSLSVTDGAKDYPPLAGNTLVQGRKPETVLRIVLEGLQSPQTGNAKTGYSMPSFVALSDDHIADVATYIRNTWGNRASPVSKSDVVRLRKALRGTN